MMQNTSDIRMKLTQSEKKFEFILFYFCLVSASPNNHGQDGFQTRFQEKNESLAASVNSCGELFFIVK